MLLLWYSSLNEIIINEILNLLTSLKEDTSTGHDDISIYMIKLLVDQVLEPLVIIINSIINSGMIANSFKISIIIPTYNKGKPNNVKNYRPIGLLTFSKIFKKVIKTR